VEGSDHSLFKVLCQYFSGRAEESHETFLSEKFLRDRRDIPLRALTAVTELNANLELVLTKWDASAHAERDFLCSRFEQVKSIA
jgi:hypothetical protein